MPSRPPTVSRRRVLFGAAAFALLGSTAVACGSSPPPPEVDELAAQLDRARADSQLATDAAARTPPPAAQALTAVASERSAHAQVLSDELVRMVGKDAPTTTATSTTAQPATAPTTKDVIAALRQSADSAGQLAAKQSGYRAGLLGSIAASCTAAYTVALVPAERRMTSPEPSADHHDHNHNLVAGGRAHHARTAVGRGERRPVRRDRDRARDHLRLRAGVGALDARCQRPGFGGDGRASGPA